MGIIFSVQWVIQVNAFALFTFRVYCFFCCCWCWWIGFSSQTCGFGSIDLKSMQAENLSNIVPLSSRSSNYIALRYCDFPPDITALGMKDKGSGYRYIVVFQYGSAVLFNIEDHEVESYHEIVRRHASGLLSEVRKYGTPINSHEAFMVDGMVEEFAGLNCAMEKT
ncbi:hypothetical protein REPUB_Repub01dG0020300 [Reevesia pubescens]